MKKNTKQRNRWRDLRKHACSPQQMLKLKGGCCKEGDDGDGGETPPEKPPPPKTTAMPTGTAWGS